MERAASLSSLLAPLRRYGVAISSNVQPHQSPRCVTTLHASIFIPEGTVIAKIPQNVLLSVNNVVDADEVGFSAERNFFHGKQDLAVLAHHVSIQYCLGNPWYCKRLQEYQPTENVSVLHSSLHSHYVTAPEEVYGKAYAYVKHSSFLFEKNLTLAPLIDLLSLEEEGNVDVKAVTFEKAKEENKLCGWGEYKRRLGGAGALVLQTHCAVPPGAALSRGGPGP